MTSPAVQAEGLRRWAAVLVTEVLAPIILIAVLTTIVSVHAAGSVGRGLLLAAVAIFFAGGLPYAILLAGIRSGRLSDRHLSKREERPAMMVIGLVSVSAGLFLLHRLDAPLDLFALMAAMVAGVAVSLGVSSFWKISIHTSCVGGTVVSLAVLVHPALAVLAPLIFVTGWARVILRDHTVPQVVAGALVGSAVAAVVLFLVLTRA